MTHAKDAKGGSIGTTTSVYRPLSIMSAVSQSGAVRGGQTAATATYFCARQEVEVPVELAAEIFRPFTAFLAKLDAGTWQGTTKTTKTEHLTLNLISHLRLVLCRGAVELRLRFPDFCLYRKYPFNSRLFTDWYESAAAEVTRLKADEAGARLKSQAPTAVVEELKLLGAKQEAVAAQVSTAAPRAFNNTSPTIPLPYPST